ncbi:MAG: hypothetical protein Q4G48_02205 [Bacteroidia bacterium]|nr:hypothetical protein [Bacteroidia bacterium]
MDSKKTNEDSSREYGTDSQHDKDADNLTAEKETHKDQINDDQKAKEHGDYREGDSDSEYPAQTEDESVHQEQEESSDPDENDEYLEDDDEIGDYRGEGREDINRDPNQRVDKGDYR